MNIKNFPIVPVVGLVIIGTFVYWLSTKVEFVDEEYFSDAIPEVAQNPYFAAGRLLAETNGFEYELAEDRRVFSDLRKSDTGVLLLSNATVLEDKRDAEHILDWIKSGGVLLTSPAGNSVFNDSTIPGWFMEQLNIEATAVNEDGYVERFDNEQLFAVPLPVVSNSQADVAQANRRDLDGGPFLVSRYYRYFKLANRETVKPETIINTGHLIHRSLGEGSYTVYSDEILFDNTHIEEFDQAYLLHWLARDSKHKKLTIVHRLADLPGLLSFTWNKFTTAILLFGVALIAFLRWASLRLGPVEQELPPINNNLITHLAARGEFWHRHKHTNTVLQDVRQAAIDKLSPHRRHSIDVQNLAEDERDNIAKLAGEQLGIDVRQAKKILFSEVRGNAAILRTNKALQEILHRKMIKP